MYRVTEGNLKNLCLWLWHVIAVKIKCTIAQLEIQYTLFLVPSSTVRDHLSFETTLAPRMHISECVGCIVAPLILTSTAHRSIDVDGKRQRCAPL